MKAVYLGKCIHIFDENSKKYVKLSATNLQTAMGPSYSPYTRNRIINHIRICLNPMFHAKRFPIQS